MHDNDLAGADVLTRVAPMTKSISSSPVRSAAAIADPNLSPFSDTWPTVLRDRQAARTAVGPVRHAVQDGDDAGVGDAPKCPPLL